MLWGKSNGGMGLGQGHWKKASPGPGQLLCGASRTAEPACAAQRACRGLQKIGCLGTGRTKGRCGGRSRIGRRWNCRQGLKITRLIFKGGVRKAFGPGSRLVASTRRNRKNRPLGSGPSRRDYHKPTMQAHASAGLGSSQVEIATSNGTQALKTIFSGILGDHADGDQCQTAGLAGVAVETGSPKSTLQRARAGK